MQLVALVIAGFFGFVVWKIALPLLFPLVVGVISGHSEERAKSFIYFYAKNQGIIRAAIALAFMAMAYFAILKLGVILGVVAVIAFAFIVWVLIVMA